MGAALHSIKGAFISNDNGKVTGNVILKYNFSFFVSPSRFNTRSSLFNLGSRDGAVVRALASHQCGPGSIPGLGVISGLSLLVLYSAPRGFSPGTPVFPSPQKPTLLNSNSIRIQWTIRATMWMPLLNPIIYYIINLENAGKLSRN